MVAGISSNSQATSLTKILGEGLTIQQTIQHLVPDLQLRSSEREIIALCHGVAIPLETPLIWASRHLAYPDNFLHIALF